MTVYSFACSTPDDWSNWHLWVKTFGSGIITACVTGSIASAAYIVAKTQREIAANKYNLDLFDKRFPIYEKYKDKFEDYIDADNVNNLPNIILSEKTLLLQVQKLFNNIKYDVDFLIKFSEIISIMKETSNDSKKCSLTEKIINSINYRNHIIKLRENDKSNQDLVKKFKEEVKKISYVKDNYNNNIKKYDFYDYSKIFSSCISKIMNKMDNQLTVSHISYDKNKNIYIYKVILGLFGWVKRVRWNN